MTQQMRWVDRSRITCDWVCPRKRYWQYEWKGRGIVPSTTQLELWLGTTIHDALAAIARAHLTGAVDIDLIAREAQKQIFDSLTAAVAGEVPESDAIDFAKEQGALVEGIVRGFYRQVWPRLIAQYPRIIAVEQEMIIKLADGLTFMARLDLILATEDDEWVYVEYKSSSSKKREWIDQWSTAVQLHSSIKAVEETLGHPVQQVIVQGLYKGYISYGKQNSPFCYAYVRGGNPPFTQDQARYDYAAGYRRQPVWERPGGVAQWVAEMPEEILTDQFMATPPIFVKEELVEAFMRQVVRREQDIACAVDAIQHAQQTVSASASIDEDMVMDATFPQHFEQCQPGWGKGCAYRRLCHGRVDDPLSSGFEWREPHHAPEVYEDA